jgi:phospholipid/cholesterol/gamma-HCH transport system ATP-binding protein
VIEVRGLCNRFGSQSVHENLDLDLYKGEILAVVGGSGSGKSVLLRSIIGLRRPSEGMVKVFGKNLPSLSEEERSQVERRFGVLFQKGALFSSLTVTENVALPLIEHAGLSRHDAEHLAAVKLALAGLPLSAADKYPSSLSGGMIKRAALARALALDPDILFLGRTHRRPRPDWRGGLRSTDPDLARRVGPERVSGDPRPRHALHHHRPCRGIGREKSAGGRPDRCGLGNQ